MLSSIQFAHSAVSTQLVTMYKGQNESGGHSSAQDNMKRITPWVTATVYFPQLNALGLETGPENILSKGINKVPYRHKLKSSSVNGGTYSRCKNPT